MSQKHTSPLDRKYKAMVRAGGALLSLVTFVVVPMFLVSFTEAEEISNTNSECADVVLLFARGSSQNDQHEFLNEPFKEKYLDKEKEAGVFFQKFKEVLDRDYPKVKYKAHSLHDFSGLYDAVGYPAVPAFSPPYTNIADAELSWFPAGDYRDSVEHGAAEAAGYIRHQKAVCPRQKIILGGYSQGAHVIGDSLFKLTNDERTIIGGVALFGDPKFKAADYNKALPFIEAGYHPWKRGTANYRDEGVLDARSPYVPEDMSRKVFSWCFRDDFICSGYSGLRVKRTVEASVGGGHVRYATFGVQQAAAEIMQTMAPDLYAMNVARGGVGRQGGVAQPIPNRPNDKPIDFLFLVNYSAGVDDVLGQLRLYTPAVIPPLSNFYSNVKYGVGDFSETSSYPKTSPRINLRQNFAPLLAAPRSPTEQLEKTFVQKLSWGTISGGGSSTGDPHIVAIEHMIREPSWRPEAKKHMVLITERPYKESYTYKLCPVALPLGTGAESSYCLTDPTQPAPAPESDDITCSSTYEILMHTQCAVGMAYTTTPIVINRKVQDVVRMAQSKGIAVSIVVPHAVSDPSIKTQLKNLAESTGGLFLAYNVFSQASYTDMMWQVLNHNGSPHMRISTQDEIDIANEWGSTTLEAKGALAVRAGVPTQLDVSHSTAAAQEYRWDFDSNGTVDKKSTAPSIEHAFTSGDSGSFLTVTTVNADQTTATTAFPVSVVEDAAYVPQPIIVPVLPQNIKAVLKDGRVIVSWDATTGEDILVVSETSTNVAITSTPLTSGTVSFVYDETYGNELELWVVGETANSERTQTPIEPNIEPPLVVVDAEDDVVILEPEPTPDLPVAPVQEAPIQSSPTNNDLQPQEPSDLQPVAPVQQVSSPPATILPDQLTSDANSDASDENTDQSNGAVAVAQNASAIDALTIQSGAITMNQAGEETSGSYATEQSVEPDVSPQVAAASTTSKSNGSSNLDITSRHSVERPKCIPCWVIIVGAICLASVWWTSRNTVNRRKPPRK